MKDNKKDNKSVVIPDNAKNSMFIANAIWNEARVKLEAEPQSEIGSFDNIMTLFDDMKPEAHGGNGIGWVLGNGRYFENAIRNLNECCADAVAKTVLLLDKDIDGLKTYLGRLEENNSTASSDMNRVATTVTGAKDYTQETRNAISYADANREFLIEILASFINVANLHAKDKVVMSAYERSLEYQRNQGVQTGVVQGKAMISAKDIAKSRAKKLSK
tara:strand:- start:1235 stop:1885 length:651 start_codon:yes stop_codon:yes gene_type:complete